MKKIVLFLLALVPMQSFAMESPVGSVDTVDIGGTAATIQSRETSPSPGLEKGFTALVEEDHEVPEEKEEGETVETESAPSDALPDLLRALTLQVKRLADAQEDQNFLTHLSKVDSEIALVDSDATFRPFDMKKAEVKIGTIFEKYGLLGEPLSKEAMKQAADEMRDSNFEKFMFYQAMYKRHQVGDTE